jgi:hypothetical protein
MPGTGPPAGGADGVITMRRAGVIVALGALLGMFGGVVTASPALARGPKWQFQPKSPLTLPASYCGFEIRVTFPVNREFLKILKTSDGTLIGLFTGSVVTSFTNPENGKTITENTSGPSKTIGFPDGSFTTMENGRNEVVIGPAAAARFGLPSVGVLDGKRTTSVAADGSFTSMSFHGHVVVDVCAALS